MEQLQIVAKIIPGAIQTNFDETMACPKTTEV
jgi:hypothetical protein